MRRFPNTLWIGLIGSLFFLIIFLFGPYFPHVDKQVHLHSYIVGDGGPLDFQLPPFAPSTHFWLGTDMKGRDLYSALIMGTRSTVLTIVSISVITFLIGIPFGIVAGHIKWFRKLLEVWNYLFSRIPTLFYIIIFVTIPFVIFSAHRPLWLGMFILFLEVGKVGELVCKQVRQTQDTLYYEAATTLGTKTIQLVTRYYLPEYGVQWFATFVQHIGSMLFLLGQLGIFDIYISQSLVQVESGAYAIVNTSIEWPMFLSDIYSTLVACPWVPFFTASVITLAMFSLHSLGEGMLQLTLSPRQKVISIRKNSSSFMNQLFPQKKNNHEI